MTPDEVRAAALSLCDIHHEFASLFGSRPAQLHAHTYLQGLLLHTERRNTEAIALHFGGGRVDALQEFMSASPWDYRDIQHRLQDLFTRDLLPSTRHRNLGTVGVLDESSFPKKGDHGVGVDRQ